MAILIESFRLSATKTAGIFYNPRSPFFLGDGPTEREKTRSLYWTKESENMTNLVGPALSMR
jgi:hypothetical protein